MQVNIIIFGQLAEILGDNLVLKDIADTNSLAVKLNEMHPGLNDKNYVMAVDKKLVTENISLSNNCTVALLPPFSGG